MSDHVTKERSLRCTNKFCQQLPRDRRGEERQHRQFRKVLGIIVFSLCYNYAGGHSGVFLLLIAFAYWLVSFYILVSACLSASGTLLPNTFFVSLGHGRIQTDVSVEGKRTLDAVGVLEKA
ncbi:hypothetical protein HPB48_014953 [Haemaphysalis longicornis]|uniref:Uncharacterized protein n=1 Tax=Haemaphysalis longicornis TaxID=44386 RepID=A0A9J6F7F9_HAELO|nr:hypothetical protein HPB48_014953 [Haemaphysalis longicornis]